MQRKNADILGGSAPLAVSSSTELARCSVCGARGVSVCGALTPAELSAFGNSMTQLSLRPGQTLVDEGSDETHVFSVVSGCLKCYKLMPDGRRQVTGFLFAGDFLGLTKSSTYTASVEAIDDVKLCRMARRKLIDLSSDIPNLDHRLHEMTSEALADVQDQLLMLGRKTAQERVATFLLTLSRRARQRCMPANPVDLPMSRDDIGDFLGLTTETVSRTFSRLRKDGIIGPDKDRKVEILRADELAEIAEGL